MDATVTAMLEELLERRGELRECRRDMEAAFALLRDCFERKGKVLVCGNGGSAADAEHIVGELMKAFRLRRPLPPEITDRLRSAKPDPALGAFLAEKLQGALPAICLSSQTSLLTAMLNDVAADLVFAQQVYGYGREGDVLIGISTSGKAADVLSALQAARVFGLGTLGLTGREGGRMERFCDVLLRVPADEVHAIQELHQPIYHTLCAMLEQEFFGR